LEVKVGVGRVRVKGIWRADIGKESLGEKRERDEKRRRKGREDLGEDEGEGSVRKQGERNF